MRRVPVDVVVRTLARSGITANARQIRNWTLRRHISHTRQGYDLHEVLRYVESRGLERHAAEADKVA